MNLEHVSGLTPLTAQEALEMVRLASGMLQSAAVCLEENMQDLTAAERRDLQAELEMMRVFKRNLEACLHFERHIAAAD